MLQQAVARHDHAKKESLASEPSTRQYSTQTGGGLGASVLGQSRSSANANKSVPNPLLTSRAVKRTSSGLSKVISNSSIGFDENTPSSATLTQSDDFLEDDFDFELDEINDATPKDNKKPKLQTLSTAHPDNASTSDNLPVGPHTDHAAPASSGNQPVPWSSSPISHLGAHPVKNLQHFAYSSTASDRHPTATPETITSTPAPAPKRKTLPWHKSAPDDIKSEKPLQAPTLSTPSVMTTKKALPWEKTSSAIKEQQKDLRETNKNRVKVSKANPDTLAQMFKKKEKGVASVFLSSEQQHVANLVTNKGQSVFFTGSAGTGKSVLLREIIKLLRSKHLKEPDRVAVTASTGLAACNIGGVTLHSFAGFGLGKEDVAECVKKIKRNGKAKQRWLRTKILVIDEVSMVDADLFDKLEAIARNIRRDGRPFGGIQLVITGDFFQLPPVPDRDRVAKFAFDADTWKASINHTIGLHHVFRQKDPGSLHAQKALLVTDTRQFLLACSTR